MQELKYTDSIYPYLLKEIYDPPCTLYYEGNIELLKMRCISIVGTRNITEYGKMLIRSFLEEDFRYLDIVFVSGLALGVDAFVHQTCIERGIKTVAIVPGNLTSAIPRKNRNIHEDIKKNGLILAEFPQYKKLGKEMFVLRNRLLAGISDTTVVIEAGEKSGSLITARYALEYNREVYAVPGNINNHFSLGCNMLLKEGANMVSSKDDFREIVGFRGDQVLLNIFP